MADEKKLVQTVKFESFKDKEVSLWMFKISKKYSQYLDVNSDKCLKNPLLYETWWFKIEK